MSKGSGNTRVSSVSIKNKSLIEAIKPQSKIYTIPKMPIRPGEYRYDISEDEELVYEYKRTVTARGTASSKRSVESSIWVTVENKNTGKHKIVAATDFSNSFDKAKKKKELDKQVKEYLKSRGVKYH